MTLATTMRYIIFFTFLTIIYPLKGQESEKPRTRIDITTGVMLKTVEKRTIRGERVVYAGSDHMPLSALDGYGLNIGVRAYFPWYRMALNYDNNLRYNWYYWTDNRKKYGFLSDHNFSLHKFFKSRKAEEKWKYFGVGYSINNTLNNYTFANTPDKNHPLYTEYNIRYSTYNFYVGVPVYKVFFEGGFLYCRNDLKHMPKITFALINARIYYRFGLNKEKILKGLKDTK